MGGTHTPGPYWVRTNTNSTHDVCGRHGVAIRNYPAHQMALADADCRRLQAGFTRQQKALHDAAPNLLAALEQLMENTVKMYAAIANGNPEAGQAFAENDPIYVTARAAIAKAKGEA